jgi:hypothetical protein
MICIVTADAVQSALVEGCVGSRQLRKKHAVPRVIGNTQAANMQTGGAESRMAGRVHDVTSLVAPTPQLGIPGGLGGSLLVQHCFAKA